MIPGEGPALYNENPLHDCWERLLVMISWGKRGREVSPVTPVTFVTRCHRAISRESAFLQGLRGKGDRSDKCHFFTSHRRGENKMKLPERSVQRKPGPGRSTVTVVTRVIYIKSFLEKISYVRQFD